MHWVLISYRLRAAGPATGPRHGAHHRDGRRRRDATMPRLRPVRRLSPRLSEGGAGGAAHAARPPARPRVDPALVGQPRGVGGVRAEAGRVVADLLRLPGSQLERHQPARGGAAAAH
jgi:hypothetical protein